MILYKNSKYHIQKESQITTMEHLTKIGKCSLFYLKTVLFCE